MKSILCRTAGVLVVLLSAACDFRFDSPVDDCPATGCIPSPPDAGRPPGSGTMPSWPASDACATASESSIFGGAWEGYFQGSEIGDERSTFRLDITGADEAHGLCGTLTFGTHTAAVAIPPATDPTAIYPDRSFYPPGPLGRPVEVILGLPYTLLGGKIDGHRTTFGASTNEVYKSWCALQTPYNGSPGAPDRWDCLPNWASETSMGPSGEWTSCFLINPDTHQKQSVPCFQWMMCCGYLDVCACDSARCTARDENNGTRWHFDLVFNGEFASGVAADRNVLLSRVSK
ncbi:MAG TPA: hypothetical protein VGK67_33375 [Myxococcales bacterium]|jgi:hypothetical protein